MQSINNKPKPNRFKKRKMFERFFKKSKKVSETEKENKKEEESKQQQSTPQKKLTNADIERYEFIFLNNYFVFCLFFHYLIDKQT